MERKPELKEGDMKNKAAPAKIERGEPEKKHEISEVKEVGPAGRGDGDDCCYPASRSPPGDIQGRPAKKFVCRICDYTWYKQFAGEEAPSCPTHHIDLTPAD